MSVKQVAGVCVACSTMAAIGSRRCGFGQAAVGRAAKAELWPFAGEMDGTSTEGRVDGWGLT